MERVADRRLVVVDDAVAGFRRLGVVADAARLG
jgi:hypothetical protein